MTGDLKTTSGRVLFEERDITDFTAVGERSAFMVRDARFRGLLTMRAGFRRTTEPYPEEPAEAGVSKESC